MEQMLIVFPESPAGQHSSVGKPSSGLDYQMDMKWSSSTIPLRCFYHA